MAPDNRLDELTAREREVLDLVRLGLTNEEIAGRLGITEAGIKYHVSQILSRLGVTTREEAAAVYAAATHVAEAFQPRRPRWWAALPLAARAAALAVVLAAVAGFALLAWGVLRTNGDEEQFEDLDITSLGGSITWTAGQVIHKVVENRGELGDAPSPTTEEYWILVGRRDNTDKAHVFLRDETGRVLQEGFSDAEARSTATIWADGSTTRIERPAEQSVFMWTMADVQAKLLDEGFALAGQTSIAALDTSIYERTVAVSGCAALSSATHIVSRVYISTHPFGLDLGEESVCLNDTGDSYQVFARVLRTLEVVEESAAPEGIFEAPQANSSGDHARP